MDNSARSRDVLGCDRKEKAVKKLLRGLTRVVVPSWVTEVVGK